MKKYMYRNKKFIKLYSNNYFFIFFYFIDFYHFKFGNDIINHSFLNFCETTIKILSKN